MAFTTMANFPVCRDWKSLAETPAAPGYGPAAASRLHKPRGARTTYHFEEAPAGTQMRVTRRRFLASGALPGASTRAVTAPARTTQVDPEGFWSLAWREEPWWLITPDGKPFFSLGLNHIDPASLRYQENLHIWRDKYDGSASKWIEESVAPNLKRWGFNTVGWVQEVTVRQWRHSRPFTTDEYRALDMPFCHLLPFMESHGWEQHTRHFDFQSPEWAEWVD